APEWRAGRLSIGYNEERDLLVLEVEEAMEEGDEADDEPAQQEGAVASDIDQALIEELERHVGDIDEEVPTGGRRVRFWATREQMLSLARHGAAVCARGRPTCQLCGNPLDPEGHVCPALNGHREMGSE
ncbi:MAG: DUF3090 domain-containing protein, partial [Actinomycetota bacterium]|nr:DUF3090 domain-containing protein [Actinomycetota bacterium]